MSLITVVSQKNCEKLIITQIPNCYDILLWKRRYHTYYGNNKI